MIKAAARQGWIEEERVVLETLTAIRRAGADLILTYFAKDVARALRGAKLGGPFRNYGDVLRRGEREGEAPAEPQTGRVECGSRRAVLESLKNRGSAGASPSQGTA